MSDDEHWYPQPWNPEELWPSVTTILGAVATKPELLAWRSREAARYAVENRADIDEMLAEGRNTEAVELAAKEPDRIATRAADLGKLFHRLAEAELKGEPATMTEEEAEAVRPYLDSFHRFLDEMQPVFHWAEATVYHQWQKYAGTSDGGCEFACPIPVVTGGGVLAEVFEAGVLLNLDWKTGRRIWPEVVPQQVGYSTATHMGIRDALGTVVPMPRVGGAAVVHIGPWGYRVHGVRVTPQARAAWEHAVAWYRWRKGQCAADLGVGLRPGGGSLCIEDLPGLPDRLKNSLALARVFTLADLESFGEAAFLAAKWGGPARAKAARQLLAIEGRTWTATETKGAA